MFKLVTQDRKEISMTTAQLKADKKKRENRTTLIRAEIAFYTEKQGCHIEDLANEIGISRASLYNRMKNSDTFSFGEFRKLCSILQLNEETMLNLVA